MSLVTVIKEPKIVLVIKAVTLPDFYGTFWKSSQPTHTKWGKPINQFPLRGVGGSISVQPSTVLETGARTPAMTALTQDEGPLNDPSYEEERSPEGEKLSPAQVREDQGAYNPDDPARQPESKPEKRVGVGPLESFEGPKMTKLRAEISEAQTKYSNAQGDAQKTLNSMMEVMERARNAGSLQLDRVTGRTFLMARGGRKNIEPKSGLTEDMNKKLSIKRNIEQRSKYHLRHLKQKFKREMLKINQGVA